ncbi:DUF4365 domain-containing protein [Nonomuraea bangladeshensis]|uniref:DUF4365 domain-containing protein n=1 Tax=Nonomuraea bangladeshensis TaxID=404385 RepID=UPI003C2FD5C0
MPKRPSQHDIASRAVAAVRKIWADAGAAVDELHEDYGEDLLVQPSLNGEMDSVRIWVQVKGTAMSNPNKSDPRARLAVGHLKRWLTTDNYVIIVLWDVRAERGWYFLPAYETSIRELHKFPDNKRLSISLDPKRKFDSKGAAYLIWHARLEHTGEAVERLRISQNSMDISAPTWPTEDIKSEQDALILEHTARIMAQLGMIERLPEGIIFTDEFRHVIETVTAKRDKDAHRYNDNYPKFASVVALESLVIQAQNSAPMLNGFPSRVMQEMHAVTSYLLGAYE